MKELMLTVILVSLLSASYPLCIADRLISAQVLPQLQSSNTDAVSTACNLLVPDEVTVYVDGTTSFDVVIQDVHENNLVLSTDKERLTAECDSSVARAEVDGQTIYLVGVQNGTTELTLHLQKKNETDTFENVTKEGNCLNATVTIICK